MLTLNKACRRSHALVHDLLPAGVGGKERLGEIAGPDRLPLTKLAFALAGVRTAVACTARVT